MGTRADYYVRRGEGPEGLEWIGSTAYDGHPDSLPGVTGSQTEEQFRAGVMERISDPDRSDGTAVEMGWPWPWEDSGMTDYAYIWEGEGVSVFQFGRGPVSASEAISCRPVFDSIKESDGIFPDMSSTGGRAPIGSRRSGVMLFGRLR